MDITQSYFRDIIVPVMKQFRNEYPDVRIEIKHDTTTALASAVGDNLMDIAFITTPYDESITKHNYKKRCIRAHKDIVEQATHSRTSKEKNFHCQQLTNILWSE